MLKACAGAFWVCPGSADVGHCAVCPAAHLPVPLMPPFPKAQTCHNPQQLTATGRDVLPVFTQITGRQAVPVTSIHFSIQAFLL